MRTTLTLDEDVYAKLRAEMRTSGRSFRETVNECLRLGLRQRRQPSKAQPFRVRAEDLGLRVGFDYNCVGELIERLERPSHR